MEMNLHKVAQKKTESNTQPEERSHAIQMMDLFAGN